MRSGWVRAALVCALFATLALAAPLNAHALGVTQASTQPNGSSGNATYGGVPTRLTWKAQVKAGDPEVTSVTLTLPKGVDLSKAQVKVLTLEGLKRKPVTTTPQIEGTSITVPFSPAIKPVTNIDITVHEVVFPFEGGTYEVKASAGTATGDIEIPSEVEPIAITAMTPSERAIYWLDQQPWVAAWNSVKFLGMFFKPQAIVASFSLVLRGWLISMALVLIGFPLAIPAGLMLAFAKMSKIAPARWVASFYVNVMRGTPLFLQMYIAFFGLPLLGVNPNKYFLGALVLALNSAAYLTEIFRAGIQSIHKGQLEAASSLGMTYWQAMQYVIIPQTVKRVLPTMTSEFILLYKDTAMLSAVGVFELMMYSKNLAAITGNITPYVVAACFYLVVTMPLIRYVQLLEQRLAVAEGGQAASENKPKKKWFRKGGARSADSYRTSASDDLPASTKHESR